MEGALLMEFSREMEIEDGCGKSMHSPHSLLPSFPARGAPASTALTAFCTCSRFSASSMAMQLGESITAPVALTLRRSGRQWENTPSLDFAILAPSPLQCLNRSRNGFSASQLPQTGTEPTRSE